MITHYIKIAFRNLLKYKVQSIISIIGLAIGFVCFALSAYWIHYEMTYDAFHRDADRIYLVRAQDALYGTSVNNLPSPTGAYLKAKYPEIEDYAIYAIIPNKLIREKKQKSINFASADSSFMRMMNIKVVEGNTNFMLPGSKEVAITEAMAKELFGIESPLGKEIELYNGKKEIGAIVTGWDKHSNLHYSFMGDVNYGKGWDYHLYHILIKLKKGTDAGNLLKKMNADFPKELKENQYGETGKQNFSITPLTSLRHAENFLRKDEIVITFNYIIYFSIAGALIIICALVNYLTIFVNRIRTRQKEMALRKVNGASGKSLIALLATEYACILLSSIFSGFILVEILLPEFNKYAAIVSSRSNMYLEIFTYILFVSLISFLIVLGIIHYFHSTTLQRSISGSAGKRNELLLRKTSIIIQLVVCLSFVFCTTIINKQLYFLKSTELGMEHHNIGSVSIWLNVDMNTWTDKIANLPMVKEILPPKYYPMVATGPMVMFHIKNWDGRDNPVEGTESINMMFAGEEYFRFYGMDLLSGEWISEKSLELEVNITESTARHLGWTVEEAIGKKMYNGEDDGFDLTVIGVVKDCQYYSPTSRVPNTAFANTEKQSFMWGRASILFKYKEGTWNECKRMIEKMHEEEFPDKMLRLFSEDEVYNDYLRSENALIKLLGFASLVCILISIFGIYSLVTLTCEQRQKEIAIRKVNGATIWTILKMFIKEYCLLLIVSSILAFPFAYLIMKKWIESYSRQVEIGFWPCILIFTGAAFIIACSIGWRVWKAANQNPAEIIKNE
ncbi:ABC transporter permease [Phocaeicola sp.]